MHRRTTESVGGRCTQVRATESVGGFACHVPGMCSGVRRRTWAGVLTMCQACTQAHDGERGRVCLPLPCARHVTQTQACDGEPWGGLACETSHVLFVCEKSACFSIPAASSGVDQASSTAIYRDGIPCAWRATKNHENATPASRA